VELRSEDGQGGQEGVSYKDSQFPVHFGIRNACYYRVFFWAPNDDPRRAPWKSIIYPSSSQMKHFSFLSSNPPSPPNMSTSSLVSQMYPPSVRPGPGILLEEAVRGMVYDPHIVSGPLSPTPSISGASVHSAATAIPSASIASLPSYASGTPNASTASLPAYTSSTTSLPSYGQLSSAPPSYATLDPRNQIQRLDQSPGVGIPRQQLQIGSPFQQQQLVPTRYTVFGQQPNGYSPLQIRCGIQYGYMPFQPQSQQPTTQYQYPSFPPQQQQHFAYAQQPIVSQTYALSPQLHFMNPWRQIQSSPSNPYQPTTLLTRVVEEDDSEDESLSQRARGMLLRGVRYHIGGRK
jgi:hypothetical protein